MEDLLALDALVAHTSAHRSRYVKRPLRDRMNPLYAYDDDQYFVRFRVRKDGFGYIFSKVESNIDTYQNVRNHPIPPVTQLAMAFRYYAGGDFQITTGDMFGVHQSTLSKKIPVISRAIASLSSEVIKFPNQEESFVTNRYFLNYANFPGITGIVDGTHIPIQSPGGPDAEVYRNRKGFFSMNCQVICDHKRKFINLVVRWPGSVHDARIWTNCRLCTEFEEGIHQGLIIGDSTYPASRQLMTPYDYPCANRIRGRFNRALCRCRVYIEQAIGIWKRRWPILSKTIRCKVENTQVIIVATAVLHNLCMDINHPLPEGDIEIHDNEDQLYDDEPFVPPPNFVFDGFDVRNAITERFAD